jgi:hypothetical protein
VLSPSNKKHIPTFIDNNPSSNESHIPSTPFINFDDDSCVTKPILTLSFASIDLICLSKKKRALSSAPIQIVDTKKIKPILKKSVQFATEDMIYIFSIPSDQTALESIHVEKQTRPSPLVVPDDGENDKNVEYVTRLKTEIKRLRLINKKQEKIITLLSDTHKIVEECSEPHDSF